jgi:hypothetical protein
MTLTTKQRYQNSLEREAELRNEIKHLQKRLEQAEARCCYIDCPHDAHCRTCEVRELAE